MSKILVIDDDAMNLKMAGFILKKNDNYEVITASSGAEGLEILNSEAIDLVLLDVEMPEMNGFQTLEKIRATDTIANVAVLFLTAEVNDEVERIAGILQAKGCVKKPFLPDVLLGRVAEILK